MIDLNISLLLSVDWVSAPRSVNSQIQMTDVKVLERGDDWQCPSMEEREGKKSDQCDCQLSDSYSVTGTGICNGSPGRRHVAFINMTDTSYICPTGLSSMSHSTRTCGQSHTDAGCS